VIVHSAPHHALPLPGITLLFRSYGIRAHTADIADVEKDISMNSSLALPPVRILVVDDHDIVRQGLAALLERDDGVKIVGSVGTGEEAVIAARRLRPDVIIMDLVLPGLNGIDATSRIMSELPRTRVIALSASHTSEHVYRALRAGAFGYLLKTAAYAELPGAVKAVAAGERYVSPAIAAQFVDGVLNTSIPNSPFDRLSARERDILRRIIAGSTSSDIAQSLSLSRKTVDTYRGRMMTKLGVANRSELIHLALDYLLPDP
jgi:DNA-binding NarL/FixJ family response regulator